VSLSLLSCYQKQRFYFSKGKGLYQSPYERKLKCLIKMKIDVFRKETPLLSKLILDNSCKSEDIIYRVKEVGKLSSFDNRNSNRA